MILEVHKSLKLGCILTLGSFGFSGTSKYLSPFPYVSSNKPFNLSVTIDFALSIPSKTAHFPNFMAFNRKAEFQSINSCPAFGFCTGTNFPIKSEFLVSSVTIQK